MFITLYRSRAMVLYKGSQRQGQVYFGNRKISKIYKGNQLIYSYDQYKPGTIILDKSVAGTYTFTLNTKRKVQVVMVGAGGGGANAHYTYLDNKQNGGSGAMLQATTILNPGTYTVVVGKGGTLAKQSDTGQTATATAGTATTFAGKTAGGGGGAWAHAGINDSRGEAGAGGTATASTGFTATQGKAGDTAGVYSGHGAGGDGATPSNGKDGYIWIKSV